MKGVAPADSADRTVSPRRAIYSPTLTAIYISSFRPFDLNALNERRAVCIEGAEWVFIFSLWSVVNPIVNPVNPHVNSVNGGFTI